MKSMKSKIIFLSTILIFAIVSAGCSEADTNVNTNTANANVPANANADPLATDKTPEITTENTAATLSPVVMAYCDAMRKKDDAALRKVYSKETLKSYEADMKAENIKTLTEYLENEPVGDKPCETRNERIEGDTAIANVKNESYPNGINIKFVKEDGGWKMTNQSPELKAVENK